MVTLGRGTGLVMYTNDDVSSDVGLITASSLSYNPARSKSVSNISGVFQIFKKMEVGNKFYIHLPGFTRNYEYVNKTHERHVNTGEERRRADILGGSTVGDSSYKDLSVLFPAAENNNNYLVWDSANSMLILEFAEEGDSNLKIEGYFLNLTV